MTAEQQRPILDDPAGMHELDRKNLVRLLNELPEQCETALGIGRSFAMGPVAIKPNVIVFVGVGDSGLPLIGPAGRWQKQPRCRL